MATQIQLRRGTASEWETENPILASGEAGVETDTGQVKFGDGSTAWNSLAYSTDNATPRMDGVLLTDDTVSATNTAEQWGTQEPAIADPGREVAISAIVTGTVQNNGTDAPRTWARVQISVDGGATWDSGDTTFAKPAGSSGGDWLPTAAQHKRIGVTPTGQIRARAQINQLDGTAGDVNFRDGTLILTVI